MRGTLEQRWRAKVRKNGNKKRCWIWIGARLSDGYGVIYSGVDEPKMLRAHRVAWEIFRDAIPSGLSVLHRCDNPSCVRPAHLFLGTHQDNMIDRAKKQHAKSDHEWRQLLREIGP